MNQKHPILTDSFGRFHDYLRISLTERCNLRCTYCMPEEGVAVSPNDRLMNFDEIYHIVSCFVKHGVQKIRLTGGEPFVRKGFPDLLRRLAELPIEIAITTNGILVDRYIDLLKECGVRKVNLSLDSLDEQKFFQITRRNYFKKVMQHMQLLQEQHFDLKVNVVLIRGFNDNEIVDFTELTKDAPISIRFIEFMPFDGNRWDRDKLVSLETIQKAWDGFYGASKMIRLQDAPNDTAKHFQVEGYAGNVAVISTVTNPFCDTCNRIRLTADGKLKNCLFSGAEMDLLSRYRNGESIEPYIEKAILAKKKVRAGMDTNEAFEEKERHKSNRSMTAIGG